MVPGNIYGDPPMTDIAGSTHRPTFSGSGEMAMARIADRLAAMAPPLLDHSPTAIVQGSACRQPSNFGARG
jgi:hypothetical protein